MEADMARGGCDAAFGRAAFGSGRVSAQRMAIARAADGTLHRAFSVEQLATNVRRDHPGIGLATVYRAITAMEAAGFVESLGTRDGATLYARCRNGDHHHHMLCTGCGAVADVACPVRPDAPERPDGFAVTGHHLVLYGLCAACGKRAAAEGAADASQPTE
jgi:Fur family ferric uptake transcriptional regulator